MSAASPTEAQQSVLLASLRAHLTASSSAAGGAAGGNFDDDILRSLLAVEDWNVSRAVTLYRQSTGAVNEEDDAATAAAIAAAAVAGADDDDLNTNAARRFQQMEIDDAGAAGFGETLRAERAPLFGGGQQLHRRASRSGFNYGGTAAAAAGGGGGPFGFAVGGPDEQRLQRAGGGAGAPGGEGLPSIWSIFYHTLTLPFTVAQGVLLFLLRLLRIRPGGGGGSGSGGAGAGLRHHPSAGSRMTIDARAAAEQYIRELELDLQQARAGDEEGPSASTSSAGAGSGSGAKTYPPLFVGSYSQACQRAKDELKVLAVILTSVDNPDSDTFRRHTLTDASLVEILSRPEFLVWAGDIREREAWQVADICDATSFPFIAFVSLQPSRTGSRPSAAASTSSTPRLAILSRHSGTSLIRPSPSTAAAQLHDHLQSLLLPRVQPYLSRLAAERARLASERALRAEQDVAFERAAQADVARVRARREAEMRRVEEERRRVAEEARVAGERRKVEDWRAWARANLVPAPPPSPSSGDASSTTILIQFRLPGGKLLSRSFRLEDELEGVFAYIETASLGDNPSALPASAPPGSPPPGYAHAYNFELVLGGYPRRKVSPAEIASSAGAGKTRLADVAGLNDTRRANVIVEGTVAGWNSNGGSGAGGSSAHSAAGDGGESSGEESD
ncbi:hypothetical protein V8E36_005984 [Tilletia maclaganii]